MGRVSRVVSVLLLALAVAGCAGGRTDFDIPPADSGWQPQGVNSVNISVMAAHPADLVRGHTEPGALGQESEPPVQRLWSGHPKPLPASNLSAEGSADSTPAQPSAGAAQPPGNN